MKVYSTYMYRWSTCTNFNKLEVLKLLVYSYNTLVCVRPRIPGTHVPHVCARYSTTVVLEYMI